MIHRGGIASRIIFDGAGRCVCGHLDIREHLTCFLFLHCGMALHYRVRRLSVPRSVGISKSLSPSFNILLTRNSVASSRSRPGFLQPNCQRLVLADATCSQIVGLPHYRQSVSSVCLSEGRQLTLSIDSCRSADGRSRRPDGARWLRSCQWLTLQRLVLGPMCRLRALGGAVSR